MKKLKFRHKIESVLHFIRLLETRNHDVSANHPGTMTENRVILIKHPGTIAKNRVILTKHPGTIIRFHEILLRNGIQLSEFAKFCSGTGYNYQN